MHLKDRQKRTRIMIRRMVGTAETSRKTKRGRHLNRVNKIIVPPLPLACILPRHAHVLPRHTPSRCNDRHRLHLNPLLPIASHRNPSTIYTCHPRTSTGDRNPDLPLHPVLPDLQLRTPLHQVESGITTMMSQPRQTRNGNLKAIMHVRRGRPIRSPQRQIKRGLMTMKDHHLPQRNGS
jgi:hypothetical protein